MDILYWIRYYWVFCMCPAQERMAPTQGPLVILLMIFESKMGKLGNVIAAVPLLFLLVNKSRCPN